MDARDGHHQRAPSLDPEDFGPIFDQHHLKIWAFLYRRGGRDCADELAGEVFVTALASRSRFDPTRGAVAPWLYGIAANLAREWLRRRARAHHAVARLARRSAAADELAATEAIDLVDDHLSSASDVRRVLAAMDRLPDHDHEVLVLFAWQGLSYEESAITLGVPVGTVRSRLSRARARLRELLELGDQLAAEPAIEEPR